MRNLITLKKDSNIIYNSTISEYIDPDIIYIPIKKNYQILVKTNENVCKGQAIMENNLNKIFSPISGIVLGVKKMNVDGINQNTIVIQNDYKEKSKDIKKNNSTIKISKEYIISKLYEFHFNDIAKILETKKINNLIINGIDDEPYILNREYLMNSYLKEILEMTDIFATYFNINNNIIAIKSNNTKNVEYFLSRIGTYPNINLKLVEDKYLIGKDFFLLEHLNLKNEESLIISLQVFLDIYNAIKYNKNSYETYITIAGTCVSRSKVIKVKRGTLLKNIIDNNIKIMKDNVLFINNGLMAGYECDINNTIVSESTIGLIIIPNETISTYECSNCGLCYRICPVKINPKKAYDYHQKSKKCIDCGLCSYICPSHINLRKYLRGESDE